MKVPPILREFFHPAQGLLDSKLYRAAMHILLETPRRTLPYPKIFLKRPKHMKFSTYHMKVWCEYRKKKTMAIREISKLLPTRNLTNTDDESVWENWRKLKDEYHINRISMRALIREVSLFWPNDQGGLKRKVQMTRRRQCCTWTFSTERRKQSLVEL